MKEVKVVIGKNFGDEGKGAAVHNLCSGENAIVVRHNGGAQAGHTVEDGNFRFVFHQLGSGSRRGCPTYWSHTFLPDLLKLGDEVEKFVAAMRENVKYAVPSVYAHPECCCTTIYDVILNSIAEQLRGGKKHGSCGMGIYEAVIRSKEECFALRLKDFVHAESEGIVERLREIREEYASKRLQTLLMEFGASDAGNDCDEWVSLFYDENVLWNAAQAMCENFRKYVVLDSWENIKEQYDTVIFENAQGLMLDEDNTEYYPHLTPSHTGLYNVASLLSDAEIAPEIIYVTRTYVTRHGAGRLDYECAKENINPAMWDRTNTPNAWQDSLRYALHPAGENFFLAIQRDLKFLEHNSKLSDALVTLYLTHLDETDDKILFCNESMDLNRFTSFCREQGIEVWELRQASPMKE